MGKNRFLRTISVVAAGIACLSIPAAANIVNVDLGGATTGTLITGVGASFAQTFAGQTVVGTGISGSPTNPLTLAPSGILEVAFWNPGVSAASNSILPQPDNQAPLSVLLDSNADSVTWTMGFADGPGPVSVDFFSDSGALVHAVNQTLVSGYNVYSFSGFGDFRGFTIFNDNDPAGLRYQNFSYNSAAGVPEPGPLLPMLAFATLAGLVYRRRHA